LRAECDERLALLAERVLDETGIEVARVIRRDDVTAKRRHVRAAVDVGLEHALVEGAHTTAQCAATERDERTRDVDVVVVVLALLVRFLLLADAVAARLVALGLRTEPRD